MVGLAALALVVFTRCSYSSEVHVVGSDRSNHLKVEKGTLGALSRDGGQVLFSRDGVVTVATRDGGVRALTGGALDESPAWSHDASWVTSPRDTDASTSPTNTTSTSGRPTGRHSGPSLAVLQTHQCGHQTGLGLPSSATRTSTS